MKRKYGCFLFLIFLVFLLRLPTGAEEESNFSSVLPDEYGGLTDSIPEDIAELLPDGLFSDNSADVAGAVTEISSFSYLLRTVLSLIGLRLGDCARTLATVCGLLLLSSVCSAVRNSLRTESIGKAFSFCSSLVILAALLSAGYRGIRSLTSYFNTLNAVTAATIPLTGTLYAMGGNVTAAVSSTAGLSVYLTVMEETVGKSILPFCGICMALALTSALEPGFRLGTLLATFKKNYTTVLTFLMMLLNAMLAAQTTISARGDTLAMKSARFAAGNLIPVVGGSVSELLKNVSAGIGYLRGTVGICGVILLLLCLLPTLTELLLARVTWQLCASLADLLGCDGEKKLLDEFASLYGYLIAAICICSSVLLLSLTLLTHCASAIG